MKKFINLYPVQKTLRFELRPVGETLKNIEEKGILTADEHRAYAYGKVKKFIDEYHKANISKSLFGLVLDASALNDVLHFSGKTDETLRNKANKAMEKLRKQIADSFDLKSLFSDKVIKIDLPAFLDDDAKNQLVAEFGNFTTYFTGFNENRRNMYTAEPKASGIAYRLINENLPKFIGNMKAFEAVREPLADQIGLLKSQFEPMLNGILLENIFSDIMNYSTLLTQEMITLYNTLIGGKSEGSVKVKGLNEYVNLYNQIHKDKLPKFVSLYKQILSDRDSLSWLPETFKSDSELLESIESFHRLFESRISNGDDESISLKDLLVSMESYDLSGIYVSMGTGFTSVMKSYTGDWDTLNKAMEEAFDRIYPCTKEKDIPKHLEKRAKYIKSFESLSIADINGYIGESKALQNYFMTLGASSENKKTLFERIEEMYSAIKDLLNTEYSKNLIQQDEDIEKLKAYLDSIKELQWFIKPLNGTGSESGRDGRFYGDFDELYGILDKVTPLYNMVRNYVTRKPYSEEKIKLNFDNSTLLAGWDVNKERDNSGVILRKGGLYYLAIMDKKFNKSFDMDSLPCEGECYEKMDYKLLPGPNKMLPKVFFSKSRIDEFAPSHSLLEHYEKGTHKKGADFSIDDCHELIDFFKASIERHEDWRKFGFHFSDTSTYSDISGFYREVELQGYKISFRNVSCSYIEKLVNEGKLYLFQIYNKDFSVFSKGTPNMHTLYWKALFSDDNLKDVVYKLNGDAEVFFRRRSIQYDDQKMKEGFHHEQLKDKFSYPIIKDRRYTADKFHLHVPITMNFKSYGMDNINMMVREYIKDGGIDHIIGIDRGERNLLYISLIDLNGNIVKQLSLNEIINRHNDSEYKTDYHSLLEKKEVDRLAARKNWKTIENIKELKEGYLSQVIHIISQMMVEYNAIVVLEDLNSGFMRGRQKVEKSVYQKFEHMLIDKLNYLVDKKHPVMEDGGLMRAYQLTSKFESFQKLGRQSGFLFYIPAWNTSKIDPVTGFANFISTKYENLDSARELLGKFKDIRYNAEKGWFEFDIDNYSSFNPKAVGRQEWTLCTYGTRIKTFRNEKKNNEWDSEEIQLADEFKVLFRTYGIDYSYNLMGYILNQSSKEFFSGMLSLLGLTLQLRNSRTETDEDYIISPVAGPDGRFFDSREYSSTSSTLPVDADANGAYNIARKGLWAIRQISLADDLMKVNLAISNESWLKFVQG